MSTPGFPVEIKTEKYKNEVYKDSEIFAIKVLKIMNKLFCTNHEEVHKSEVDSPPDYCSTILPLQIRRFVFCVTFFFEFLFNLMFYDELAKFPIGRS